MNKNTTRLAGGFAALILAAALCALAACSDSTVDGGDIDLSGVWKNSSGNTVTIDGATFVADSGSAGSNRYEKGTFTVTGMAITFTTTHNSSDSSNWNAVTATTRTGTLASDNKSFTIPDGGTTTTFSKQ